MKVLLSIITINYNNIKGLKRTLESVVNQTWKEFEYIVIDGGSTDGSENYIKSESDNISYWRSEPDKGIYDAMNKGILKANGEYLLFLNSGDHFYNNGVLEKNHIFLNKADLIYFNLNIIENLNSWVKKYPKYLSFSYFNIDTLPHPATFIRKDLFNIVGLYDENLKIVSDWKFFITSICKHNCSYINIDRIMSSFYTDGVCSDPSNQELILKERRSVIDSEFPAFIHDVDELNKLKNIIRDLKKSKKIQILIKLGLLKKI